MGSTDRIAATTNLETHAMHALPSHLHNLARFEERRAQLAETARIELLAARIVTTVRRADTIIAVVTGYYERAIAAQPTMAWITGEPHTPGFRLYRSQPRDGRGRFLSKAWLAGAELFTAADRAWFRHPVGGER